MARLFSELARSSRRTIAVSLIAASTIYGAGNAILNPAFAARPLKLIEQKPIFDTTYLPKQSQPFQLGIKHTSIIYPKQLKLRGNAKLVDLRGEENTSVLKGGVTQTEQTSEISTVERSIATRFHLDLASMIPKIAPDISRRLDAEIDKAKQKLAASIAAMPPSQPAPAPNMVPRIPQPAPVPNDLSKQLEAARNRVSQNKAKPPDAQLAMVSTGGGAGLAAPGALKMPAVPAASVNAKLTIPDPHKQQQNIAGKVAMPKTQTTAAANDLAAQLRSEEAKAKLLAKNATPDLAALQAKAKLMPSPQMPTATADANGELIGSKLAILWDEWHKRFAKLAGDQLLKHINQSGNPLGTNTVRVTVTPDHHLSISIDKKANQKFDNAVLQAYRALDGNAMLAYPPGSLRSSVSFVVDNKYTQVGVPVVVRSKTLTNDREEISRGR